MYETAFVLIVCMNEGAMVSEKEFLKNRTAEKEFVKKDSVEEILRTKFPVWNRLSEPERKRMIQSAQFKTYKKGEQIHNGSNDCIGVLIVLSGELNASMLAENGRSISLFRIFEGETCVLSASCALVSITFDIFIDAQTDVTMLIVPSDVLKKLMEENPWVEAFTYKTSTERFSDVMWVFYQVLFVSFDKRLAKYLLEEADDKNGQRVLRRTHEQIAKDLGSAREVVSRMLKYFEQEGLVTLSRGSITLADEAGLSDLANRVE